MQRIPRGRDPILSTHTFDKNCLRNMIDPLKQFPLFICICTEQIKKIELNDKTYFSTVGINGLVNLYL